MRVEVEQCDDSERGLPAEAESADNIYHLQYAIVAIGAVAGIGNMSQYGRSRGTYLVREPLDKAVLIEVGGHADQGCKPGQRVPGSIVAEAFFPGDHVCDQHDAQSQEGSCHRPNAKLAAKDPQCNRDSEGSSRQLLVQ